MWAENDRLIAWSQVWAEVEQRGGTRCLELFVGGIAVSYDTQEEQAIRRFVDQLVGGAPLNEAFGESVGADAYCRDAAVAVETAKALIAKRREVGAA